jgi:hypothetical protein
MAMTNATHLVVSDPTLGIQIQRAGFFNLLTRIGRFSVFELRGAVSAWITPIGQEAAVYAVEYRTGAVGCRVSQNPRGPVLLVKTSFHPFWRLRGLEDARVTEEPSGLMRLKNLPGGDHRIELRYEAPAWPKWVSVAGWLALALLSFLPRKRFA